MWLYLTQILRLVRHGDQRCPGPSLDLAGLRRACAPRLTAESRAERAEPDPASLHVEVEVQTNNISQARQGRDGQLRIACLKPSYLQHLERLVLQRRREFGVQREKIVVIKDDVKGRTILEDVF